MFEFLEIVSQPNYKLNDTKPFLITALTRSAKKRVWEKTNKISKTKKLTAKSQYLNGKAPSKQRQNANG